MNWGTTRPWSTWTSANTLFRGDYQRLRAFGRPLMISEIATVPEGGDAAAWVAQTMNTFKRSYPAVRAVTWFDHRHNPTIDFRLSARSQRTLTSTLTHPYWRPPLRLAPLDAPPAMSARTAPP
jgi:hypothetical protein